MFVFEVSFEKTYAIPQVGRAIARAVSRRFPGFNPTSNHVRIMVAKVAMVHVSAEYFGFPSQFSFRRLLNIHYHHHPGEGTKGQMVADIPIRFNLNPPTEIIIIV
jgi:hypothetical protein